MRHVWIDKGQRPNPAALDAHGIKRWYMDARDEPVLADAKYERGIYRVQSWDNATPAALAQELSADVHRWGGDPYKQLAVHVNIEHASLGDRFADYIAHLLYEWRKPRPQRDTMLVLDGIQGGALDHLVVAQINSDVNLVVLAEDYDGEMNPLGSDLVRSNLIDYGVQRARVAVTYDAARLGEFWDGCAFTQGRLK